MLIQFRLSGSYLVQACQGKVLANFTRECFSEKQPKLRQVPPIKPQGSNWDELKNYTKE